MTVDGQDRSAVFDILHLCSSLSLTRIEAHDICRIYVHVHAMLTRLPFYHHPY